MKKILFTLFILFQFSRTFGSIAVGIPNDKINIWRYWEKRDTGYQYKMIVFNISDSVLTFSLEQWNANGAGKNEIVINKILIDKNEYKIFDMLFDADNCFSFYINKSHIGNLCTHSYPGNISRDKFISDEGLNGMACGFWVSKNNLFTDSEAMDTLILHINYKPLARVPNDGVFTLDLKPYMNYKYFTARINNSKAGSSNIKGDYKIELPYYSEYNEQTLKDIKSNEETDIQIIYSVKVPDKLFIGLGCYSKINVLEKEIINKQIYYRKNQHRNSSVELPVMVQK